MDEYVPLLGCESCKTQTRHNFSGTRRCVYETAETRRGLSKSQEKRLQASAAFDLLIYKCSACGLERGWGNIQPDEGEGDG